MKKLLILLGATFLLTSCAIGSDVSTTDTGATSTGQAVSETSRTIPTPTYGSGAHVLIEFADFECPACIATNDSIMPIFEEYAAAGHLTIEYRQYPLYPKPHPNSMGDALAALCAADQGKYFEYGKELYKMEKAKNSASVSDSERIALASNVGIDTTTFASCLSDRVFAAQIASDMAYGNSFGIRGTPTFFLDGVRLDLSIFKSIDALRTFLDQKLVNNS